MQGRLTNTGLKGREDSLWRFGAFDGISDTPLLTYIASSDNRCWSDAFWIDDIILPRTSIITNLCFNWHLRLACNSRRQSSVNTELQGLSWPIESDM